jgi:regulator of replication initiation timing
MERIFIECDYFKKEINTTIKKNTALKNSNKILVENNISLKNENKVLNEKLNEQSFQLVKLKQNRILWAGAGILTGAIIISIIK